MITAVIQLRVGDEAWQRIQDALTGRDDDVLLRVEQAIQKRIYARDHGAPGDPYVDPLGVFVDGVEVSTL